MRRRQFIHFAFARSSKVVLVVAADAEWLLYAGGAVAGMISSGAEAHLIRIGNDEKQSWDLQPEETALRNRRESEVAAKILGIRSVVSLGFRSSELRDVPHTTLRDRLMIHIRRLRPGVLFIPNPHTEHDRNLDRYYAGAAAEDAWHCARFANFLPAASDHGLEPHLVSEVYYYAPPVDPRRREPESTATFVPQPLQTDIGGAFARKLEAALALDTINRDRAMRLKQTLEASGQRLRVLDSVDGAVVRRIAEENVRGLARICAGGTSFAQAEEFRYAGIDFGIPREYR
ncbi:MAG: PIG-L family deacetylase [Acidobacteria bacterium]|nr:PIG-L family deacetylase [Acidobacteriota bacterium]